MAAEVEGVTFRLGSGHSTFSFCMLDQIRSKSLCLPHLHLLSKQKNNSILLHCFVWLGAYYEDTENIELFLLPSWGFSQVWRKDLMIHSHRFAVQPLWLYLSHNPAGLNGLTWLPNRFSTEAPNCILQFSPPRVILASALGMKFALQTEDFLRVHPLTEISPEMDCGFPQKSH